MVSRRTWGPASGTQRRAALERTLHRVRVGGLCFAVVQNITDPGTVVAIDWLVTAVLALTCVTVVAVLRQCPDERRLARLGAVAFAADAVVIAGFMANNTRGLENTTFITAVVVAFEAATRWSLRGGVLGGIGTGAATVGWTLLRAWLHGIPVLSGVVTFRFGIMVLFGTMAGAAIRRVEDEGRAHERSLEVARDLIVTIDRDGRVASANPAARGILGYDPDDLVGRHYTELMVPGEEAVVADVLTRLTDGAPAIVVEARHRRADGTDVWLEVNVNPVTSDGLLYCAARDVTERRRAEAAIRESEARFRTAFGRASIAMGITAVGGTFLQVNDALCAFLDRTEDELLRTSARDVIHPDDRDLAREHLRRLHAGEVESFRLEQRYLRGDGSVVWGESSTAVVRRPDGGPVQLITQIQDVTERRAYEARLSYQAMHDHLTGLPNRALFLDRLGHALDRMQRQPGAIAVLFLDLDRFKTVNDSLGHGSGDELLVLTARRLRAVLRPGDTVARFGGDEFTVLCEGIDGVEEARALATRILEVLREPFVLSGEETFVGASIGIAVATGSEERPEALLRDADAALYRAKERGRGRYEVFDDAMRVHAVERLETQNGLRRALERGELRVLYQPEVAVTDGRIVAVEALVRWDHPVLGLVAPSQFIPVAEETGLILPLGEWLLGTACRQLRAWGDERPEWDGVMMAVNLSARQLAQPGLVDIVAGAIELADIDPALLCLEITESVLMDDAEAALQVLQALRALGVRLAVDDFGTGYSSLSYLKRFPVDVLKVDRSFVAGVDVDSEDAAIVAAVTTMGHTLGLTVVAEGVETAEQLAVLRGLHCDLAQGFHFAPALPPSELAARFLPSPARV